MFRAIYISFISCIALNAIASEPGSACSDQMSRIPGLKSDLIGLTCTKMANLTSCQSKSAAPIYHFDRDGQLKNAKRILTISLIHGDELPSGEVAFGWIQRLQKIEPRNSWRVIPMVNPGGVAQKTRTNANGVDLNRNFPTENWENTALKSWRAQKSDPRRYPGPQAASESETKCLLQHIEQFKPDFIISIHTPIGVLDFDGPAVRIPKGAPLPWNPLGNFPGSLGRFMWKDNKVPVLTIELKGNSSVKKLEEIDLLQDISGSIALEADRKRGEMK